MPHHHTKPLIIPRERHRNQQHAGRQEVDTTPPAAAEQPSSQVAEAPSSEPDERADAPLRTDPPPGETASSRPAVETGRPNPELVWRERRRGTRPGGTYVRIVRPHPREFRHVGPGHLAVLPEAYTPRRGIARVLAQAKRIVIGRPIATAHEVHERLDKVRALAVFSSDALSSVAYGPEQVLLTLMAAGTAAMTLGVPITLAVAVLVIIVAVSYRQTIYAYPSGGGSYIVAKDNLGVLPGLVAAAALLVDYVLTVAVSISAGVSAIVSVWPELDVHRVPIGIAFITLITLANLRGIRESGALFAVPTYVFIFSVLGTIAVGIVRTVFLGQPLVVEGVTPAHVHSEPLTLWLILRAFASGSSTLTGIEAVANGVPAFKPPESRNAAITLSWMAGLLASMALGVAFLAHQLQAIPSETETVLSQIGRTVLGGTGVPYLVLQASTMLILVLAANTSHADFPRLSSILARDKFMPTQFAFRGDRLAFSNGIMVLGILAALLVWAYGASEHHLIPLYAVGVFLSFTLSQFGMVRHWYRERGKGWRRSLLVNLVGGTTTLLVLLVIAVTKFEQGAWMVILVIPVLVLIMRGIYQHYQAVADQIVVVDATPRRIRTTAVVPVADLNEPVLRALDYARSIADTVIAVHVSDDPKEMEALRVKWQRWVPDVPLVLLESPYRSLIGPLLAYIEALKEQSGPNPITVVLPEYVPAHWWELLLHNQTALRIKAALLFKPGVVVADVPYHLKR